MKNIYLNAGSVQDVFTNLKIALNGTWSGNHDSFTLTLNTSSIKGNVRVITFGPTITSVQVRMTFLDDTTVSLESFSNSSVVFAYCNEGLLKYSFGISGQQLTLSNHHSAVITSTKSVNTILHFKKNSSVQFTIIKTETLALNANLENNSLLSNLKKTFIDTRANFICQGFQSLKIEELIFQLTAETNHGNTAHALNREIVESLLLIEIDKNTSPILKLTQGIKNLALNQIKHSRKMYKIINQHALSLLYMKISNSKNNIYSK